MQHHKEEIECMQILVIIQVGDLHEQKFLALIYETIAIK